MRQLRRMVHTLKGIAGNFYAEPLLTAVLTLEKEMENEINMDVCEEGMIRIQIEIESDNWREARCPASKLPE